MTYKHVSQLFTNSDHRIVKSHCFLCHRPVTINKPVRGNCCIDCDYRASRVSKYIITEEQADRELSRLTEEFDVETWTIDGVEYYKHPDGLLELTSSYERIQGIED